jgi:hypothetical protein
VTKLVTAISAVLFLTNYVVASVVIILVIDWIDAGTVHWSLWPPPAVIGFLSGLAALLVEVALYHDLGFWPRNIALFYLRVLAVSLFGLAVSVTLSYAAEAILASGNSTELVGSAVVLPLLPLITVFYFPLMIPFGIFLGMASSILIRLSHAFQWS